MQNQKAAIRLLLTGGGTGGHLFPAIATAQEFQAQFNETEVLFVGTKRKVDTKSLQSYGFKSQTITCHGLKGKNIKELLKAVGTLPLSYLQARKIIKQFKPTIVVGVGGYVTGPVVLAARRLEVPAVIHEQNSVPGLANRKLGNIVSKVCLSLPDSGSCFEASKVVHTGNPVRRSILELAKQSQKNKTPGEKKCLLILGGSQGALWVNKTVSAALASFTEDERKKLRVIHQTGEHFIDEVRQQYSEIGLEAVVEPFFMKMEQIYEQADLLVSRAGATTLSEMAVLGKPAILIPYPYAADNHQVKNGNYYVAGGGALLYEQKDLSGHLLKDTILELLKNDTKLANMSASMKKLGIPDAAKRIVSCCVEEISAANIKS